MCTITFYEYILIICDMLIIDDLTKILSQLQGRFHALHSQSNHANISTIYELTFLLICRNCAGSAIKTCVG